MQRLVVLMLLLISQIPLSAQTNTEREMLLSKANTLRDSIPGKALSYYHIVWKSLMNKLDPIKPALANGMGYTYYKLGQYDSALYYYHIGLSSSSFINDAREMASSCTGLAETFLSRAQRDSSRLYLNRALKVSSDNNLLEEQADAYSTLGNVEVQENNYEPALQYFIKAANLYDSLVDDPVGFSRALLNIANVHYSLGNTEKALDYIQKCRDLAQKHNYKQGLAFSSKLRGRIYRKTRQLSEALQAYKEALEAYRRMGDVPNQSEIFNSMGNIYYDLKDFKNAQYHYQQSLTQAKRNNTQSLIAYNYSSLGFTFFEQRKWKEAIVFLDSSRVLAAKTGYPYLVMDAYQILGKIEEERKNYEKALFYTNKFMSIKDSLSAAENRAAIEEVDARYQDEKQAGEIALLQKDNQIQAAALRQNRIVQISIMLAAIAVVIIAVLLINRSRIIHRTRRQIELEKVRHQIATDLHDDIGATLSSINIVSSLALQNNTDQTSATHFERIRDQSEQILENMSDIIWSIHPSHDSMDQVILRMKDFSTEILEPKNIVCTFHNTELLSRVSLDINSRKNLFLIFKEAVNNAAKYSGASAINIFIEGSQQRWTMKIADNGAGFNTNDSRTGNGLANMKKRTETMGMHFSLASEPTKGTEVTIASA